MAVPSRENTELNEFVLKGTQIDVPSDRARLAMCSCVRAPQRHRGRAPSCGGPIASWQALPRACFHAVGGPSRQGRRHVCAQSAVGLLTAIATTPPASPCTSKRG